MGSTVRDAALRMSEKESEDRLITQTVLEGKNIMILAYSRQ